MELDTGVDVEVGKGVDVETAGVGVGVDKDAVEVADGVAVDVTPPLTDHTWKSLA